MINDHFALRFSIVVVDGNLACQQSVAQLSMAERNVDEKSSAEDEMKMMKKKKWL